MKELQTSQSKWQKFIQSTVHSCVSSSENIKILIEVTEALFAKEKIWWYLHL